jgi:two-component system response regulator RegA
MEPHQAVPYEGARIPQENTLLIVDDDRPFLARLARAMETRGFEVEAAASVEEGLASLRRRPPAFAVVDMRLEDGNGIDVIAALKGVRPEARAVVLTGYGNIATAVTAVKLGAVDYLAKPADADDVYNRNVSETARRLNMHRRTLQRILAKRAPK